MQLTGVIFSLQIQILNVPLKGVTASCNQVFNNSFNLFQMLHFGDIGPMLETLDLQVVTSPEIERGPAVTAIVPGVRDVPFWTGDDRLYRYLRLRLLSY